MGMERETANAIKNCDTRNCKNTEKEGMYAVQISKDRKLNGRSYRGWLKSLVKQKGSDPSIEKESYLPQAHVNATGPKDSSDNESTNTNGSRSLSQPKRTDFQLRWVSNSGHAKKSYSPELAAQTELQNIENNVLESRGNGDESKLQEKIVHPYEEENKSTTTEFIEYWVPVRLSNIQTEQYCGSLFSNSTLLCSSYKFDNLKVLHEILVSTKNCCDHPYLVDQSLHTSLIQGIPQAEQWDTQIKLSSKLYLLYKALMEINKRGLRVLILYQSIEGSGPITIGDMLDDIIHEKFGGDSFVRIDGNIGRSKRREVLDTFNEKDGGKFVFLMETRACAPSIKLKSIDSVIFFNSDWDPMNDLKALRKINLDSQFKQVKVFRLYSAYTVEEKALILTKLGMAPVGDVRHISRRTCHELLTWGAYYSFEKLQDFHAVRDTNTIDSYGNSFVEDVFHELSNLLPNNDKSNADIKSSTILKVQQIGGVYPTDISLLGELGYPLMDNFSVIEEMLTKEPPYIFWINILQGRTPSWKYFSYKSPRTRKGVQLLDFSPEECGGPTKRCRTTAGTIACQTSGEAASPRNTRTPILDKPSLTKLLSLLPCVDPDQSDHQLESESSLQHCAGAPTQRAPNTNEAVRARETCPGTHIEVLQSVCKALQTELEKLEKCKTESSKQHKDMKLQSRLAYEREVDEIRKKYDAMLQTAEEAFLEEKKAIDSRYNKIFVNKAFVEALMQTDNKSAPHTQVLATKFSVEQAHRLIFDTPGSRTEHRSAISSCSDLHHHQVSGLRAPAPHLRLSPACTVPTLPSEPPRITFSPVSLEQVTFPLPR
ncbi:helicase protein MOM1-like isoform X1 [Salvia splendens]|uniref:helicase protein MOM1-like isoform X1 n=1 Tax=Salvia splendens TaxID=180675 RepID=UPI001C2590C3|nr:helicase protein MOM1-like isoform X1 [Salvia splendens]XP_042046015.1 helicase protein MOM1-like isoform X1 [Salvia splendens]